MKIMQKTGPYARTTLSITRAGIVARYWRPRAGGGWYPSNSVMVEWPWKKVS